VQSVATTATDIVVTMLSRPLAISAPTPNNAGTTGTGRPPWLAVIHMNNTHSAFSTMSEDIMSSVRYAVA
jgi:hypothetical protein